MGGMGIDLNITPDVDMVGGEEECGCEEEGGGDHWDEEVDSNGDPDVDDVPDDIDDEDINASSIGEQMRHILIQNNPGPHMSLIDPDAAYVVEFPEYPEVVHRHELAVTSDDDELFIGQRFSCKEECVYAIKWYSMNISVDYKVAVSTPTIYVGECWKTAEGCNWRTIKVSVLITEMQAQFQYQVSYRKAWIAKQMAMEQLYGDYDSSYNKLQGWIVAMREYVPGIVIELQTRPYYSPNGQLQSVKRIFHRMFWTFDPCVRASPHCKPLVQVDGTWLYEKYIQILLITVAQDGNRNVLPIAFAIVDKENMESWKFFLTNLRRYVISNDNICIISDRGKGLIAAIRRSGVPWRSVYCIRHITTNFHKDYKNADWKSQQKMIRLESDIEGQTNTSFRQWLGIMESWQWAQSFDEGFRFGQMATNLVEGINAVLLKTRHLSIASVFSATFYKLATLMPRMGQQQVDQIEAGHVFAEHVRDTMVVNRRLARSYGVDLQNQRCECRRFETLHYPCALVVAACAKVNVNVEQYVNDVYTLERTSHVWENEFPVLPDLSTWEVPLTTFELLPNRGLRRNPRGRPQSSRIRNEMDIREKSDGKRCGICRLSGHSRNKCHNRNFHVGQSSGSSRN
ncbi:uncharacterized protein [Gossypium hirsutum]|uniref:SWIM-type domain-containing protein n=1 Tax=Gossypium hirsutum TaxID=3635 RepID=A0A1U8I480_GOSHI|nr:uncharacterized protein LOC107892474 [Gossypium hirsutum]